jgi:hypothetical protein
LFNLNPALTSQFKYAVVVKELPADIAMDISDITDGHQADAAAAVAAGNVFDWDNAYNLLQESLRSRHADSDRQAIAKIIAQQTLGDEKPSVFLRRLRGFTAGRNMQMDDVIRQKFLAALPRVVQTPLALQPAATLDELGRTADAMMEVYRDPSSSTVNHVAVPAVGAIVSVPAQGAAAQSGGPFTNPDPNFQFLVNAISQLQRQVNDLAAVSRSATKRDNEDSAGDSGAERGRDKQKKNKGARARSKSNARYNKPDTPGVCWYHNVWGQEAVRCKPPCIWLPGQQPAVQYVAPVAPPQQVVNAVSNPPPAVTCSMSELTGLLQQAMRSNPNSGN